MVAAHVTDAWTRVEDRERTLYGYTVIIAGLAAPLFLFLAGLTLSMAASARAASVSTSTLTASRKAFTVLDCRASPTALRSTVKICSSSALARPRS